MNEELQESGGYTAGIDTVDIRDDFMFSYVMSDSRICIELLQYLLPEHKIERIEYSEFDDEDEAAVDGKRKAPEVVTQKALAESFSKRGVRLDAYVDDGANVYTIEMQTTRQSALPKRARLYQAHMDINQLSRGQYYDKLRPGFVIFICTFDPFGRGLSRYSFRNVCKEEDFELKDEAYKLFFNTTGTRGEISESLREILRYINNPAGYPVEKTKLPLIHKMDRAVDMAKKSKEWRKAYMKFQLAQQDAERRGEARGEARGEKRGEARGEKRGEAREKRVTANKMLGEHLPLDLISRVTGLSIEEIDHLKTTPNANS